MLCNLKFTQLLFAKSGLLQKCWLNVVLTYRGMQDNIIIN